MRSRNELRKPRDELLTKFGADLGLGDAGPRASTERGVHWRDACSSLRPRKEKSRMPRPERRSFETSDGPVMRRVPAEATPLHCEESATDVHADPRSNHL